MLFDSELFTCIVASTSLVLIDLQANIWSPSPRIAPNQPTAITTTPHSFVSAFTRSPSLIRS